MKVSIILPVFNGSKDIHKAIECILNQEYKEFEFIMIDDASTDNSFAIMKKYAEKDNRIKIIRNYNNIGLTKSLNKAIMSSKGEFIARHDVDDISSRNRLKKQIEFLETNEKYAFCGTNGRQIRERLDLTEIFEYNEIRKILIAENCFSHPTIVIRKEIFENYGYYNETFRYGQDYELWCRLIYKFGLRAKNLKDKLVLRNMPETKLLKKNKTKFLIQRINSIRTKLKYIRYSQYKIKCIFSILIRILEIIIITRIMGKFEKFLRRINI
ncbi:MAG: glycosyltransferase family 2 protein [Candidatus Lokiarchaeia archaeon]